MSEERQVEQKVVVETTPELAFEAVTKASELREWFCDQAWTEVQPGGRYAVRWNQGYISEGTFAELDAPRRAVVTWQGAGEPGQTTVEFTVEPVDGGVEVSVVHSGFGPGEEWDGPLAEAEKGWRTGLENLKSTLETGVDQRLARQPFLGVIFDNLDAEQAAREGIAAEQGIYVTGTVEGSGARAAGLDRGDVIVAVGGAETPGGRELGAALRACQAGDVVDMEVVRGQERETIQVTLGRRPPADVPDTATAMAQVVAEQYRETDAELRALLEGVSDEEADQSPAEGEWSIKRVLAHLSAGERWFQVFLTYLAVNGWVDAAPVGNEAFPGRLSAVLAMTPTVQGLLERFFADEAETVALLRELPEATLAHKARFYRMAQIMPLASNHTRGHIQQIQDILAAVRGG